MGKLSPISIKYLIKVKFKAKAFVEKTDVIGAIFGQTEGLLGSDLELMELQKKGKIGRIEASIKRINDGTTGIIEIPTALNKTETTLIAAAIETIDRIGPAESEFKIIEIKDVREEKRKYIVERAKELLKKITLQIPETKEIEDEVKTKLRVSDIKEIGKEKLPAGNIEVNKIIVVEGRADVVNLVKHGINNVLGLNGLKIPSTIKKILKDKEVTLFIDGDRGGLLLLKNILKSKIKLDYIARAPDGKEVEELTNKEIYSALRKKKRVEEFLEEIEESSSTKKRTKKSTGKKYLEKIYNKIKLFLNEVKGSGSVFVVDERYRLVRTFSKSLLKKNLKGIGGYCLIVDGTLDDYLITKAEKAGFEIIAARNFNIKEQHNATLISF